MVRNRMHWMMSLFVLVALAGAPFALWSGETAVAAQDGDKDALHEEMSTVDRSLRMLRRSAKDASKNADSLEAITALQVSLVKAKAMTPPRAAKVSEGDRAKFIADYRREMNVVLTKTIEMENAILDGNNDKAAEIYEAIKAMEDPSHEKFAEEAQ